MKKRWLSLFLSLCLVLSLLSGVAGAAGKHPFQDVPSSHWANESVGYVYSNNLMNGTSPSAFSPEDTLTRAMFVTILGRLEGIDPNSYSGTAFSDVKTGQWYSAYITWASQESIVNGTGNGRFSPDQSVTREEMATMIARYVTSKNLSLPDADNPIERFADTDSVSDWAQDGLDLMRKTGILSGYSDKTFGPKKTATRAEAATVFMRFHLLISEDTPDTPDVPEAEGFDYKDDVILLPDSTQHTSKGNLITFPKQANLENLQTGDIIVIGTEAAYKVSHASVTGNSVEIEYTTPELYEFLDAINLEGTAYLDFSQFVPADGVTVSYNNAQEVSIPSGSKSTIHPNFNITFEDDISIGNGWTLTYEINEKIPAIDYKFDIDLMPLSINNAYIKLQEDLDISFTLSQSTNSSENVLAKTFHVGTVPAFGADGTGITVELYAVLNTNLSFDIQYEVTGVIGCQVLNNQPYNLTKLTSTQKELKLSGGMKAGPKINLCAKIFGQDLIKCTAEAGITASGEVVKRQTGTICFDGNVDLYGTITAFDGDFIQKNLDFTKTWVIWDANSNPLQMKAHYENMNRVSQCTYSDESTDDSTISVSRTVRSTPLNLRTQTSMKNESEGWSWNGETRTLILDNVNFVASDNQAVLDIDSATIILKGKNTITNTYNNTKSSYIVSGIRSAFLTFEGDGSLVVQGGKTKGASYGIYASGVTINNGSVTAIGKSTSQNGSSAGIFAYNLTMNAGSLIAEGGVADTSSTCYGVHIYDGDLTVNGGDLKASCGTAHHTSSTMICAAGIYVYGRPGIQLGNTVTVTSPAPWSIGKFSGSQNPQFTILNSSGAPAKAVSIG